MLEGDQAVRVSEVMGLLADPERLLVLSAIGDREVTSPELLEELGSDRVDVTAHLEALEERGLIRARHDGEGQLLHRVRDMRVLGFLQLVREVLDAPADGPSAATRSPERSQTRVASAASSASAVEA